MADTPVRGRIRRLIRLVDLVHKGFPRTAAELSDLLGVTKRTIFRDIRILQDAGVDITSRPGGGYSLSARFMISTQSLTGQEMVGLMVLAKMAETTPKSDPTRAAAKVMQRIIAQLPEREREECERIAKAHLARLGITGSDA